jgi:hypothetical protein
MDPYELSAGLDFDDGNDYSGGLGYDFDFDSNDYSGGLGYDFDGGTTPDWFNDDYAYSGAGSFEEQAAINNAIAQVAASGNLSDSDRAALQTAVAAGNAAATGGGGFGASMGAMLSALAGNPAMLSLLGAGLMQGTGFGKAPDVGGYKGKVKEYTPVRERIEYTDPNRRPGAGGRQYFTPTQYVPAGDTAALDTAKTAAQEQAAGILAGYTPATAPTPAANIIKTPWEKTAASNTGVAAAASPLPQIPNALDIAKATYPEKFVEKAAATPMAKGGPAMRKPRYLQGITDGMEDKIRTSIDGKQPALLSHGEFVIPADVVSHLGNGNSDAGAKKLYQMMDRIRQARTGTKKQGKQINPDKFMPGGQVGYDQGGIVAFQAGGSSGVTTPTPTPNTTKAGNLSEWVGDYTTQALGEAQATAAMPYQAYTGPMTAGASDLQTNAFAGAKNLAETGYTPGTFTTGTFDATAANKYMNPYISQSLDPQLKELRRQAQISNLGTLAKAGRAGVASGASRDLMESENMRNLLGKQADVLGQGYATAYDKAMQQFNTEQGRQFDVQKADEESRKASADFARSTLADLERLGKTQRDIESEGIAADLKEFEAQRDYGLKMPQYKIGLLQKLPVETTTNETANSALNELLSSAAGIGQLLKLMGR